MESGMMATLSVLTRYKTFAPGWIMAAKIVRRKEKRAEVEAAEKKAKSRPEEGSGGEERARQAQEPGQEREGRAAQGVLGCVQSVAQADRAVRVQRKERGRQEGQGTHGLRQVPALRAAGEGSGAGVDVAGVSRRLRHTATVCFPRRPLSRRAFLACRIPACRSRGSRRRRSPRLDAPGSS